MPVRTRKSPGADPVQAFATPASDPQQYAAKLSALAKRSEHAEAAEAASGQFAASCPLYPRKRT